MKKLILSAVILLGSLSAFAQTAPEEGNEATKAVATEATVTQAAATTEVGAAQTAAIPTDGYTEIKTEELPVALTDALEKSFPSAKLTKANINEKKQYRLDVEVGNREGSLYADENGKWIQK